jgi:hypothetical protein
MAEKPHPLGLSNEAGNAVNKVLADQKAAEEKANAPKDDRPEDVPAVIAQIVQDYSKPGEEKPKEEKKKRFGFRKRD